MQHSVCHAPIEYNINLLPVSYSCELIRIESDASVTCVDGRHMPDANAKPLQIHQDHLQKLYID